jgi:hypothetical protein
MPDSPLTVRAAAIVQAAEAVVVLAATILAGVDAASGQSYHLSSGIALTVIGALSTAALAWIAWGLAQARTWSRTPALLTQLFVGIVGIYLLQGHRLDWGIASVVLAVFGFAALLAPASFRALASGRREVPGDPATPGREPAAAGDGQPGAKAKPPAAAAKQPGAKPKPPAAAGKQPGTKAKPPAAAGKQPGTKAKPPAAGSKQSAAGRKQPAPASGRKRPAR